MRVLIKVRPVRENSTHCLRKRSDRRCHRVQGILFQHVSILVNTEQWRRRTIYGIEKFEGKEIAVFDGGELVTEDGGIISSVLARNDDCACQCGSENDGGDEFCSELHDEQRRLFWLEK